MSKLTPYGLEVRKLRLEKGMRLLDVAAQLDKSAAFISAIETGRKPIPDGFITHVARAMDLSADEIRKLRRAADKTRKEVRVENLSGDNRELVAAFARRLDEVPEELKTELRKHVLKSGDHEIPFRRKRRGIVVPPRSAADIRIFADKIRSLFVEKDVIKFPIMDVLEFRMTKVFRDFVFDVQSRAAMGEDEGRVIAGENSLILREDIYRGAWNDDGRDRFTACHELAHYLMHRTVTLARARDDDDKIFVDSEWQADTFAGTVLMSPTHLHIFNDADDASRRCGMSGTAASVMWNKYEADGYFNRGLDFYGG